MQAAGKKRHTAVPGAGNGSVRRKDAVLERGTVVGAVWAHGVNLAVLVYEEHLALLDALDLDLLHLPALYIERGQPLELVLLRHGASAGAKGGLCGNGKGSRLEERSE